MSQITQTTLLPQVVATQPEPSVASFRQSLQSGWLVDPRYDLFFFANLGWPVLVLLQWWGGLEIQSGISFWQVYFITTPHRWITPALLFLERDRLQANKTKYILITVCLLTIPVAVKISTGALTCLLTIDYIWNAWHFAAQHHGIYSIYGRKTGGLSAGRLRIDKWLMRGFLLYVTFRIASWASTGTAASQGWGVLDYAFAVIPVSMILRELWQLKAQTVGRCLYFTSVMTLYLAMLGAVVAQNPMMLLVLTTASALFHSIEYLAIVNWSVDRTRKSGQSTTPLFRRLMPRWGLILAVFVVILGMGAWLMESHLLELWLTANLIMAFLHYAYDGLLWKSRRPARMKRQKLQGHSTDPSMTEVDRECETTKAAPGRSLIIILAIIVSCLMGGWVSTVRNTGSLSLPYLRVDIAIVCFVCMLPLAILISDWLYRIFSHQSPPLFKLVQIIFYIGAAVILILALSSSPPSGTLSSYDAWESIILRPVLAFWLMLTLCLLEGQVSGRGTYTDLSWKQGPLIWGLALITAILVPAIYIQSRVDEIVTTIDESLGSGRLGEARRLTREVCVLAPWQKIGGLPAGDLARDLDRSCYEIERNLAYMQLEPADSEESAYQRARLLTILGKGEAAIRVLAPWKDQQTVSPLSCQLLGNIYQQQEQWGESEDWYQKSLNAWKRLPHSEQQQAGIVSAWKGIAFAERKRGNYEEAESAYLSALSLAPQADQHFLLAQFYEDTQQTAKAREHATQAMALNAARYGKSGQQLITSLQQQHFGCLTVWRQGNP